jgi:heme/copper-type cytochrome/quinol oxidase subunit 2
LRVRFTAVHLVGGNRHEHIASLKAVDTATGQQYDDTRANWVAYIERKNSGFVHDPYGNEISVYVNGNQYVKWVQTYADGIWTDNLLQLPKY